MKINFPAAVKITAAISKTRLLFEMENEFIVFKTMIFSSYNILPTIQGAYF